MEQDIIYKSLITKTQNETDALRSEFEECKRQHKWDFLSLIGFSRNHAIEVVDIGRKCENDEYEKKSYIFDNQEKTIGQFNPLDYTQEEDLRSEAIKAPNTSDYCLSIRTR